NEAPTAPVPSSPFGLVVQHSSAAWLRWQASSDNDGDPLLYTLEIGTWPFVLRGTGTSETADFVTAPLSFGTTYYWRVTARDSYLGLPLQSRASSVENFVLGLTNVPPGSFAVIKGTGTVVTRDSSVLLSWSRATDPDGDVPVYELFWRRHDQAQPEIMTTTAAAVTMNGLTFGSTYYWSVRARDDYQAESLMNGGVVQSFIATFLSDPPDPLRLTAPFMASPTIKTMRDGVEVSWERVTNPQGDAISYTAYLGGSPLDLAAVARVEQAAGLGVAALRAVSLSIRPQAEAREDGNTVRLRLTGLDYYRSYYFKVTAENPYGAASQTPLQAFSLAAADRFPRVYNYPNPFSSGRGGTNVVFNALSSGYQRAVLTVYSEFGQKLYERDCGRVPPGISEVRFDGRDQHGRVLMSGSYVGRVRFDGPSETATFFLLVVK
ncbi:MAG: fibronectin type III domain-containing protein, partial [Elusimicrobiota bacterium]|nr:fibronectin type III domain-containing protein [Elusimicrobiota bacterium]